jgi:hypothetical protein
MTAIGHTTWVIPEGYLPPEDQSAHTSRDLVSHEAACVINTGAADAHIEITLYFADQEPVGPYRVVVPARRTRHIRFNDLEDPQPVPRATDYSSVIVSDVAVVVQYTRLDSRDPAVSLLSTMAFPAPNRPLDRGL